MPCEENGTKLSLDKILLYNFRGYCTPIFASIGLIGNLLVIATFWRLQRRKPSRFNLYISGIAFIQIIDLISNAWLDDFVGRGLTWISDCTIHVKLDTINSFLCKLLSYAPKCTSLMGNTLLVAFSADRLLTLTSPIKFRGDRSINYVKIILIIVIAIGLLTFVPQLMYSNLVVKRNHQSLIGITTCQYADPLHFGVQFVLYASICGAYILPTFLIVNINILIFIKLKNALSNRHTLSISPSARSPCSELHRVIGHLILTSVFLFLTIPLVVVIVLRQQSDFSYFHVTHRQYADRLVTLSRLFSSFDSIIYSSQLPIFLFFVPNFRHMLALSLVNLPIISRFPCSQRYTEERSYLLTPNWTVRRGIRAMTRATTRTIMAASKRRRTIY